jgi:peptidoglycan/xylan/chitin deacetylase (PgdA/CDA1 family)
MRTRRVVALAAVLLAAACQARTDVVALPSPAVPPPATASPLPSPSPSAVPLVPWRGPVEALFVHPLVLHPALAFRADRLGQGFRDYFVTDRELSGVLTGLYDRGWTLVDVHRAAAGTVRVPPGRRPLVLYEDDVNYYRYFTGRGLASALVLTPQGPRAVVDGALSERDVVPVVEDFVAAHPLFSADGARGVLALTGYEGLFGDRDPTSPAVRALAGWLTTHGWTLASHTYGHITLASASLRVVRRDLAHWQAIAAGLGPVDVLVYPFGSRPGAAARRVLRDAGFTIQVDIDVRPQRTVRDGVTLLSRRHVDGLAFDNPARMAPFFDVAAVVDPER